MIAVRLDDTVFSTGPGLARGGLAQDLRAAFILLIASADQDVDLTPVEASCLEVEFQPFGVLGQRCELLGKEVGVPA